MTKKKPKLIQGECRRGCGNTLYTLDRSIHGLDKLREKYYMICANCLTPDEQKEMLLAMGEQIARNIS